MNGKALLAGAGANAAGYAVTAAGVLVGIGALSRCLTPEQFGAYFLLMMLPSILGSFDFGLNVQVTRSVARWRTGEAPIEEVNAVQAAYLTVGGAIFLVGAVVIVLFTEPINRLLSLGDAGPGRLYWLLALTYATLAFTSVSLVAALRRMGGQARAYAEAHFDIDRIADRFEAVLTGT